MKRNVISLFNLSLIVLLILVSTSAVWASETEVNGGDQPYACNHEWQFDGHGQTSEYYRMNAIYHARYKTEKYKCNICKAKQSFIMQGEWVEDSEQDHYKLGAYYIDNGHINPNQHLWSKACATAFCTHEQSMNVYCFGPPCFAPNSSVYRN